MNVRDGHIARPDLERFPDNPLFNTKAVVQQTGVPAPTLRAWEHRYAILAPERANNDYRLYSERDIVLIRWLKDRIDSGMAISQAIALLRHLDEEYQQAHKLQERGRDQQGSGQVFQVTLPRIHIENGQAPAAEPGESEPDAMQARLVPTAQNSPRLPGDDPTLSRWPAVHNMYLVREQLLEAFNSLDERTAQRLMSSMLSIHSIEQVCSELITPALWQIGQLWEKGQITVSVEHFASNFFRGLLANLLYVTLTPDSGPLVLACCAPGEPHELAPMILALLLRRTGVRVAYLGQSIETAGLVQTVKQLHPALICISVTIPAYLATLIDLGHQLQALPEPRGILVFGGQAFIQHTHLASHVPGMYISGDLQTTVAQLRRLVLEQAETGE
ncbi:MAG: cobalamin B12-binding domain-containing protein [Ktedonobacteraceae bacterium]